MIWDQYDTTLGRAIKTTAQRARDATAIIFDERNGARSLSWMDADEQSDRIAVWLHQQGIERGDRVGVMCTVRPEYILIYMACVKLGAVLVGVNALYKGQEVSQLVARTSPKILFVVERDGDRPVCDEIAEVLADGGGCRVVKLHTDQPQQGLLFDAIAETPTSEQRHWLAQRTAEIDPDDAALFVFTSGSTGVPKAVVLTHRNLIVNLAVQIRCFQMKADDRLLVHMPLNHVGAATELVVPSFLLGSSMVLIERFDPQHALDVVARHRVTFLHQVPAMYIKEFNLPNFEQYDLSSLRTMTVAGATTPPAVMAKMMEKVPQVFTGYGMTELGGFVTYTEANDDPDTISFTVGKIAPEFELKIVDDDKKEVPIGARGEVALRGDCCFKGYFGDEASTNEALDKNGWYYSGDIGVLDERRYLTLVDRKKLMFITGGYNVYPREIEDYVGRHDAVEFAACLPKPHDVMGEVGVLFVKLKDGTVRDTTAIERFCVDGLATYKVPRDIRVLKEFPLTPIGKIDRQKLSESIR